MSFSFDFHAKPADVSALLESDTGAKAAPDCVKEFVRRAIEGLPADLVHVKGHGHLFAKDYQTSTATILVEPITFRMAPSA